MAMNLMTNTKKPYGVKDYLKKQRPRIEPPPNGTFMVFTILYDGGNDFGMSMASAQNRCMA
jgi:tryptophan-rich sensory protein